MAVSESALWNGILIPSVIISSGSVLSSIVLLLRNWKSEHVRVRGKVMLISMCVGFILTFAFNFQLGYSRYDFMENKISKVVWLLIVPSAIALIFGPFMLKSLVLFFKFEIAHEQKMFSSSRTKEITSDVVLPMESSWFSNHRFWISEKCQFLFQVCWAFFVLIFAVNDRIIPFSNIFFGLIAVCVILTCAYRFRKSQDFWGIKKEMKFLGYLLLFAVVMFLIDFLVLRTNPQLELFSGVVENLWTTVALNLVYFMSIIHPLAKAEQEFSNKRIVISTSYVGKDFETDHSAAALPNLEAVSKAQVPRGLNCDDILFNLLQNPEFESLFREHLASEFSLENLLFIQAVSVFNKSLLESIKENRLSSGKLEKALTEAHSLCQTFIWDGSPSQVNLSWKNQKYIQRTLQTLEEDLKENLTNVEIQSAFAEGLEGLFTSSVEEIFWVLQMDSFTRFKQTDAYRIFKNKNAPIKVADTQQAR